MNGEWVKHNWMYAGVVAGFFLFAMVPLFAADWSLPLLLVFLQLPLYMMHQLEEHAGDRFRTYVNTRVAQVADALTTDAVVVINLPLVWGVDLVVLYLARFAALGFGLIAVYLTVVNALLHVVMAIRFRGYNPGLATAVVLFLPFGIWGLVVLSQSPGVGLGDHILGLGLAVLVHVAIAVHVFRRTKMLRVG
jgi:Protein of unknown function with HXXEE motif